MSGTGEGKQGRFGGVAMAEGLANEILLLRLAVYRAVRLGREDAVTRSVAALVEALVADHRSGFSAAGLDAMLSMAAEEVLEMP